MPATDQLSKFFQLESEDLHEYAKKGLWLSLFTGLLGIIISSFSLLVFLTVSVSPGQDEAVFVSWITSKGLSLIITILLFVPIVKMLRWISIRINKDSEYARAFSDPVISLIWLFLGLSAIIFTVRNLDTYPRIETPLGAILVSGYYFIFAGVGTAAAVSWVYALTTMVLYFKYLRINEIVSRVANIFNVFWNITLYPKLYYRYAKTRNTTLAGASFVLIKKAIGEVRSELSKQRTEQEAKQDSDKNSD